MLSGILLTIAACFCWGLVFVIPSFVKNFHPLEIALGRYFVYGFLSFSLILIKNRKLFSKTYLSYWKKASYLAFFSTILCYTGTVFNMQYAGATAATLVFAMSPICITLAGNWHKKEYPFRKLIFPLLLMIIGIFLAEAKGNNSIERSSLLLYMLGLFLGLFGLASWTWFAVANSHFMKQNKDLPVSSWALMMGTSTFFHVLLIGTVFFIFSENRDKYYSFSSEIQTFILTSLLL